MIHSTFLPHGVCFLWRSDLVWLHVLSDLGIAFAYLLIPALIWASLRSLRPILHGHDLKAVGYYFVAFILMCSLTHITSVVTIWTPVYYLQGWIKALTAAVSFVAAIQFWRISGRIAKATEQALAKKEYAGMINEVIASMQRHGEI